MLHARQAGEVSVKYKSQIPPGWSYNPSGFAERWVMAVAGLAGFVVATYLALYQLGVIARPYDPIFGSKSSIAILASPLARLLPVPDAALGAFAYLAEVVLDLIGGRDRWCTMPWVVVLFALVVGAFGFASVLLLIFQPVLFNAWCTLCLVSAAISIGVAGSAMDELLAALQHLKGRYDFKTPGPTAAAQVLPWTGTVPHLINVALGIWLIVAPDILSYSGGLSVFHRIVGSLAIGAAATAAREATRPLRWVNVGLGFLLILSLYYIDSSPLGALDGAGVGVAMLLLAVKGKTTRYSFDGGWRVLWIRSHGSHSHEL